MIELIERHWAFLTAAAAGFGGYVTAREQGRASLTALQADNATLQEDVKSLQSAVASQGVLLAEIATDLKWIKKRGDA